MDPWLDIAGGNGRPPGQKRRRETPHPGSAATPPGAPETARKLLRTRLRFPTGNIP